MKKNIGIRSLMFGSILSLALASVSATSAFAQAAPTGGGGNGGAGGPPGGAGGAGGPGGAGGGRQAGGGGAPGGAGGPGGQAPNPDEFINRMMANDANGDGKLSKDEVPGGFADRLFEAGDTNKDGFLTKDELKAMAGRLGGPGGQGGRQGGQQIGFGQYMNQAGRAVKSIEKSNFDAASHDADLQAVSSIELGLVGAKARIATAPMSEKAKKKYGTDEAAFHRDMRKQLMDAIMIAFELDNAIVAGNSADAKKAFAKLDAAEDAGHDAFKPEEDERGPGGPPPGGAAPGGAGGQGGAPGGPPPQRRPGGAGGGGNGGAGGGGGNGGGAGG